MLIDIITDKIKAAGPISFKDFMELALYYPGGGYYSSGSDHTGKKTDYFTSPGLTCMYGHMIAKQIEDMWFSMGKGPFTIVEFGAGDGRMSGDIISYLEMNSCLYDHLDYFIIEKNTLLYSNKKQSLHPKVQCIKNINDIGPVTGCIISNELIDNFPVHRVIMKEELMEIFVSLNEAGKIEEIMKPASMVVKNYLEMQQIELQKNTFAEINLAAVAWLYEIASTLQKGYVLTIDYGGTSNELFNKYGKAGTLHCYHKHSINTDFYSNIGTQDITAYVNFSALHFFGLKYELQLCGYTSQSHFLQSLGLAAYINESEKNGKLEALSADQKLYMVNTLLYTMGQQFKVLIQQKNLPPKSLQGLQFSSCKAFY